MRFCRSIRGVQQIPLPTRLSISSRAGQNFHCPATPFNYFSGICKNLADTWPAATRVLSLSGERTLGTRLRKSFFRCLSDVIVVRLWQQRIWRNKETVDQLLQWMLSLLLRCDLSTSTSLCLLHEPYSAKFISVTRGRRWLQRHWKTWFSFVLLLLRSFSFTLCYLMLTQGSIDYARTIWPHNLACKFKKLNPTWQAQNVTSWTI